MCINLGRLGFLSSIESRLGGFAIHELAKGRYHYDERTMIYLDTDSDIFMESGWLSMILHCTREIIHP
jgi:NAD kinase